MGITISPWMMAFLMLMTGFAGFVDSAAGGGGLIRRPAETVHDAKHYRFFRHKLKLLLYR